MYMIFNNIEYDKKLFEKKKSLLFAMKYLDEIYMYMYLQKTALLCLVLKDVNKNMIYDYSGISCIFGVFYPHLQNLHARKRNNINVFSGVLFVWNAKISVQHSR